MHKKLIILLLVLLCINNSKVLAQNEELIVKEEVTKDTVTTKSNTYNPLSPSKAAFYSAVFPGLGQAFNKKYWKIPIVYGALGTSIYVYDYNNKQYKRAREAFKLRIAGKPDEFDGLDGKPFLTVTALESAQTSAKKDKDLSLMIGVALYVLQIVEASVNAHLLQHNIDDKLTLDPKLITDPINNKTYLGASLNLNF